MDERTHFWPDHCCDVLVGGVRSAAMVVNAGSPSLNVPVRDRKKAALDVARDALRRIAENTYEREARDEANAALRRVDVILNA